MSYQEEYIIAGRTIEVTKKYITHSNKNRSPKTTSTSEAQQKVNRAAAVKKLRLLLNNNFADGRDAHVVLTYMPDARPSDPAAARELLDKFMRKLRGLYRKNNKTLKYITVTEYKNQAIHHHLVINDANAQEVKSCWPYGKINLTPLYTGGQYGELAEYLIKETDKTFKEKRSPYRKRFNASKTLEKPKTIVKIVKAAKWRDNPKPKKGYYIDKTSLYNGVNPFTGGYYQFYRMIELSSFKKRRINT